MADKMFKCPECENYTMQTVCPECQVGTKDIKPARFSPEDKYGKYRRQLKWESMHE